MADQLQDSTASIIFGFIVVVQGLVTPGDPAQTAKDITESSGLFRLGIAALYLVIPLDIVVGWALYRVFSPVSKSLSMLAATLRVAFAVVFMVAISRLVDVLRLLDNDSSLAAFSPEQLHTQALLAITAYNDVPSGDAISSSLVRAVCSGVIVVHVFAAKSYRYTVLTVTVVMPPTTYAKFPDTTARPYVVPAGIGAPVDHVFDAIS